MWLWFCELDVCCWSCAWIEKGAWHCFHLFSSETTKHPENIPFAFTSWLCSANSYGVCVLFIISWSDLEQGSALFNVISSLVLYLYHYSVCDSLDSCSFGWSQETSMICTRSFSMSAFARAALVFVSAGPGHLRSVVGAARRRQALWDLWATHIATCRKRTLTSTRNWLQARLVQDMEHAKLPRTAARWVSSRSVGVLEAPRCRVVSSLFGPYTIAHTSLRRSLQRTCHGPALLTLTQLIWHASLAQI